MPFDPRVHHRRTLRLRGFDYAQPAAYFVTLCTRKREPLFGMVARGVLKLNGLGRIVEQEWMRTGIVRPEVKLDAFVVMPDHLHGIIVITDRNPHAHARRSAGGPVAPASGSLGAIVGQFKSIVTKRINGARGTPGQAVWQRGYFERVVRDAAALKAIRRYIVDNPVRWDRPTPTGVGR